MSTSIAHPQMPLSVGLDDKATFDTFYCAPSNHQIVEALKALTSGDFLYLWGSSGAGCSHLLQAACHAYGSDALYLPLSQLKEHSPQEVFFGLDQMPMLVLDEIEAVAARVEWSEQLFHLYNKVAENKGILLMGANCAPRELTTPLADLQSRLSAMQIYHVQSLSDEEKTRALIQRASNRGLEMSTQVAEFLISRYSRDMADQIQILELLDQGSLATKRKLSIPLVKELLP